MFFKAWKENNCEYINQNLILKSSPLQPSWTKAVREAKFVGRQKNFIVSTGTDII